MDARSAQKEQASGDLRRKYAILESPISISGDFIYSPPNTMAGCLMILDLWF